VTRVLIVDDHPVFCDGLAGLLATLPGIEVAGAAGTAEDALAAIKQTAPDVVLMDINLPGASGVGATRRAAQIAPGTAVLVVTMVDDDDTVFARPGRGGARLRPQGRVRRRDRRGAAPRRRGRRRVRRGGRQPAPRPHARAAVRAGDPAPAR
jgi:CheY-like chemotaxis protein